LSSLLIGYVNGVYAFVMFSSVSETALHYHLAHYNNIHKDSESVGCQQLPIYSVAIYVLLSLTPLVHQYASSNEQP
jgi:hypothetical protein